MHSYRIKGGKTRLLFFMIATHIANGKYRRQNPQARGNKTKNSTQRGNRKCQRNTFGEIGDNKRWHITSQYIHSHMNGGKQRNNRTYRACRIPPCGTHRQKGRQ